MFAAFFLPALIGGLATLCASMVGRVLLALGIAFVTYKGAGAGVDAILGHIKNAFSGAPSEAVNLLAFLWVDKAVTVMFSAFTAAMAVKATAGAVTKMVIKK